MESAVAQFQNNILHFYSKADDLPENPYGLPVNTARILSNFTICDRPIVLKVSSRRTVKIPTVEHAYQLQKCLESCESEAQRSDCLEKFLSPDTDSKKAKKLGKSFLKAYQLETPDYWDDVKVARMRELVFQRIRASRDLQSILQIIAVHRLRLVHLSQLDVFWGATVRECRAEGEEGTLTIHVEGRNELGNIYHDYINQEILSNPV